MENEIRRIIRSEAASIQGIPVTEGYAKAVDLIFSHVHEKKGKVVCSGMGKAGQVANNIATTFSSTGTPSVFLHPSDAQHGDLGILQPDDVLVLVSNSGKTREIIELVNLAESFAGSIPKIIITGNPQSPLAQTAEVCLLTGNPPEICPLGLTPTSSMTAMMVIGDILVVLMMNKIGFTTSDYAKRHHGGYLGLVSRKNGKL